MTVLLRVEKVRGYFHQGREVSNNFRIQAGYMAAILTAVLKSIRKICLANREESIYDLSRGDFCQASALPFANRLFPNPGTGWSWRFRRIVTDAGNLSNQFS